MRCLQSDVIAATKMSANTKTEPDVSFAACIDDRIAYVTRIRAN